MSESISSSLTVTDPRQAELMIHPDFSPLMDELTGREASIGLLAERLNMPLDAVHYRVKKLCRVGLVQVMREEKRGGRPIKVYRAVADSFFLPYAAFTAATLEEKFLRHELQIARSLVRSYVRLLHEEYVRPGGIGPYFYRDAEGRIQEDLATGPDEAINLDEAFPTTTEHLCGLSLSDKEARALKMELDAIAMKYRRPERGSLTHVMRVWMVPGRTEDWE